MVFGKLTPSLNIDIKAYEPKKKIRTTSNLFSHNELAKLNNGLKSNNIPTLGLAIINEGTLHQVPKVYGKLHRWRHRKLIIQFSNVASYIYNRNAIIALKFGEFGQMGLDEPILLNNSDPDVCRADPKSKKLTNQE